MSRQHTIAAAILAGGKNSRMGKDKALLDFNGKTFIGRIAEALSQQFSPLVIVSDYRDRYCFLKLPVYSDVFKNCGPLGGIYSVLKNIQGEVFITSCDTPFINRNVIQRLIDARGDEDVTVFSINDSIQPLCGIYNSRILPVLEEHLKAKQFSVVKFLEEVRMAHLDLPPNNNANHALLNINTPEEYAQYCACAAM